MSCQIQEKGTETINNCKLEELRFQDTSTIQLEDLQEWVNTKRVQTVEELMFALPDVYRRNFSLVEHTKALGQSDLNSPRIILFGEDGHLLFNISTMEKAVTYDKVDGMILDKKSGDWELFQLDFTNKNIEVRRSPQECFRCHGEKHPKPLWGSSNEWPGVFGDNEAKGPNGEALSLRHLNKMNEIKDKKVTNKRLLSLEWDTLQQLRSGGVRKIKNNRFGAELIVSNQFIGSSVSLGIYQRMKNKDQELLKELSIPLLLLTAQQHDSISLGSITQSKLKQNTGLEIDALYSKLGIEPSFDFSIKDSKENSTTDKFWRLGKGNIYEQIALQLLYDLSNEDKQIYQLLNSTKTEVHCVSKDHTINNLLELVHHKMQYMYLLSGKGKANIAEEYLPLDDDEVYLSILKPIYQKLQHLYVMEQTL